MVETSTVKRRMVSIPTHVHRRLELVQSMLHEERGHELTLGQIVAEALHRTWGELEGEA